MSTSPSETRSGVKPFALMFKSRAPEVVVPSASLAEAEAREDRFFEDRNIVFARTLEAASTTKSTVRTPSNTPHSSTSNTVRQVGTMGGIDQGAEVTTDEHTDNQLDGSDDTSAADD